MRPVRRLFIAVLTFMLVIATFASVTFAWISLATINNIDGIGLTASAGEDLELSVDGINFYNTLPSIFMNQMFGGVSLKDITTIDGITFNYGGLRSKYDLAIPNKDYVSFDVWIRTTRPQHHIYLINNISETVDYDNPEPGTFAISQGIYWMATETFTNGPLPEDVVHKGEIDRYYAKDVIRIGIVELIDDLNPLDQRESSELQNLIYDPQERPDRGFGSTYGAYSYFFNRTLRFLYLPETFPNTTYRLSEMDPRFPYQALDNDSLIATLQPTETYDEDNKVYYQAKVRINIWAEGWDADAFDAIENDIVRVQLQFKAAYKATQTDLN